ncbi:MAG: SAM-dependent methyltransferase [Flavobacteriaceae bacterium]|nr:SAM-dependent methyltransferase [Flavobacteriaceae bacterium]
MQKEITSDWYASWFDTPYYHILYKDRDNAEANSFMDRLTQFLQLEENDTILDLACGKGRHAISLSQKGFQVTGVDLSPSSIAFAKQFESERLKFRVHDMCLPYPQRFNAVFNLFTSFGYFENEDDNLRTIKAIKKELKANGHGVIDFMNSEYVIKNLVPAEVKEVEGITFHIKRYVSEGYIFKEIKFQHNDIPFSYTERVKALRLADFKEYFEKAGLKTAHCFGDYHLNEYDEATSDRLILIFN